MDLSFEDFSTMINNVLTMWDYCDAIEKINEKYGFPSTFEHDLYVTMYDDIIKLLGITLNDEEHWIEYWLFDLDCGNAYVDGAVVDDNGNNIKLETLEDLWMFLRNNK